MNAIHGYDYGTTATRSPLNMEDLAQLKDAVLFGEEDIRYLRMAGEVLADQVEAVVNRHVEFVAANPSRLAYFSDAQGNLQEQYVAAVTKRFGQWVLDLCRRDFDQEWLHYQHEIGLRHTSDKKNRTDAAKAVPHIPLRYLVAFIYDTTEMMREFFAAKGHDRRDQDGMYRAWFKANVLSVALWSMPYAREGMA